MRATESEACKLRAPNLAVPDAFKGLPHYVPRWAAPCKKAGCQLASFLTRAAAHTGTDAQAGIQRCFLIAAFRLTRPAQRDPAAVRTCWCTELV